MFMQLQLLSDDMVNITCALKIMLIKGLKEITEEKKMVDALTRS